MLSNVYVLGNNFITIQVDTLFTSFYYSHFSTFYIVTFTYSNFYTFRIYPEEIKNQERLIL